MKAEIPSGADPSRELLQAAKALAQNLSYDEIFIQETQEEEEAQGAGLSRLGAVAVNASRAIEDLPYYVVRQESSERKIWWAHAGSQQHPLEEESFEAIRQGAWKELSGKKLYVMDVFCGSHPEARLAIRFVSEWVWRAHFVKNMFVRPTSLEAQTFKVDWTILDVCERGLPEDLGCTAPSATLTNLDERLTMIVGARNDAQIKDAVFSLMSYRLGERGQVLLASSASQSVEDAESCLFLGGAGSGKSTLVHDPRRLLIGDDEQAWHRHGLSNLEGGCYTRYLSLDEDLKRVLRKNALIEGPADADQVSGQRDIWVSYPLEHRRHALRPSSLGKHPSRLFILIEDSIGIFPPLARLSQEQALYFFLSGYTRGGVPQGRVGDFSPCFRASHLMLPPPRYAELLAKAMREKGTKTYLLNTGYRGPKPEDKISVAESRALLQAVFSGEADQALCRTTSLFNLDVPQAVSGLDPEILRNRWQDSRARERAEQNLAGLFTKHFSRFSGYALGERLSRQGPRLSSSS